MNNNVTKDFNKSDLGLLFFRVSLSILILFHGFSHLMNGAAGVKGILASVGLPEFLAYGSLVGEIVAPIMILLGFRARIGGAVMAFNMLVAILTAHASQIFQLSPYGGWFIELPVLYMVGALTIMFTGAGRFALSTKSNLD